MPAGPTAPPLWILGSSGDGAALAAHFGTAFSFAHFINAVGGVRITEPASDLAVLLAVVSSLKNKPLSDKLIVFGEVGLAGEVRPVQRGQERLREAATHGFRRAIVPRANVPKAARFKDMEVIAVERLSDALEQA